MNWLVSSSICQLDSWTVRSISVLLCHLWLTTTNLSYRFPILETSATASCGTTGNWGYNQAHPPTRTGKLHLIHMIFWWGMILHSNKSTLLQTKSSPQKMLFRVPYLWIVTCYVRFRGGSGATKTIWKLQRGRSSHQEPCRLKYLYLVNVPVPTCRAAMHPSKRHCSIGSSQAHH